MSGVAIETGCQDEDEEETPPSLHVLRFLSPVTKSKWDINVDLVAIWGPGWGAVDIPTVTELYSLLDFPKKKNTDVVDV